MGFFALALAILAGVCVVLPHPGMFLAMGLGILGLGLGLVGYRRQDARPAARLSGAAAMTIACLALGAAGVRYWATLKAIEQLGDLL